MVPETTCRIAADRRDELVDALCTVVATDAATERTAGAPTPELDEAVARWSRDVPSPADVLGLVAQVRARTRDNRSRRHAETLKRVELVGVEAVAQRQVREALTDPLSGLATRARLEPEAQHLVAACSRTRSPLTAVILDVDGLKRINDEQGHVAGDAAIAEAGRAIRTHLRGADRAFRYGGDEFALFLPGTSPAGAQVLVDRIRRSCTTSLSAGVAVHSGRPQDTDVAAWLSQADAELYGRRREQRSTPTVVRTRPRLAGLATLALAVVTAAGVGLAVPVAVRSLTGGSSPHARPAAPAASAPRSPATVRAPRATPRHVVPVAARPTPAVVVVVPSPASLPAVQLPQPEQPGLPTSVPSVLPTLPAGLPTPAPTPSTPGVVGGVLQGVGQLLDALL